MTSDDLDDKINALIPAVKEAIAALDDPWSDMRHHTARDLRELLDRLESSGNPGQLSDPVTANHAVNWGFCPECDCTDLAFPGWPHGLSQDVLCGHCGWSGVFVDNQESKLETPPESG